MQSKARICDFSSILFHAYAHSSPALTSLDNRLRYTYVLLVLAVHREKKLEIVKMVFLKIRLLFD